MIIDKKWTIIYYNLTPKEQRAFAKWLRQKHEGTREEKLFSALYKRDVDILALLDEETKDKKKEERIARKVWNDYKEKASDKGENMEFDKRKMDKEMSLLAEKLDDFLVFSHEIADKSLRYVRLLDIYSKMNTIELMKRPLAEIGNSEEYYARYQYLLYYQHYNRKIESGEDKMTPLLEAFYLYSLSEQSYMWLIAKENEKRKGIKAIPTDYMDLLAPFLPAFPHFKQDTLLSFYANFAETLLKTKPTTADFENILDSIEKNKFFFKSYQLNGIWTILYNAVNELSEVALLWKLMKFALNENLFYEGKTVLLRNYLNLIRTFSRHFDTESYPKEDWQKILQLEKGLSEKDKTHEESYKIAQMLVAWKNKDYQKIRREYWMYPHFKEPKRVFEAEFLVLKTKFSLEMEKPLSRRFQEIDIKMDILDELAEKFTLLKKDFFAKDKSEKWYTSRLTSFQAELEVWDFLLKTARNIYLENAKTPQLQEEIALQRKGLEERRIEYDKHWYERILLQIETNK